MRSEELLTKGLSLTRRHVRILIDAPDLEGLAQLMNNGFTIQESMNLLESKKNSNVFQEIRERMENGGEVSVFFAEYCPKEWRTYLRGFLRFLNLADCLNLTLQIVKGEKKQKEEYRHGLFYPCMMFLATVLGLFLFNEFCFPPLLSMMDGFHVSTSSFALTRSFLRIFCLLATICLMAFLAILIYFTREKNAVKGYLLAGKIFPDSILTQYVSADFIRFFLECIRMRVPTRQTLHILKGTAHKPVISFIASSIEASLLNGDRFEDAVNTNLLDPSLCRFMKIAVFSSNMEEMLEGYLNMSKQRVQRQCRHITRIIQLSSYSIIGVALILVYQVLMMPLSILSNI